MSSSSTRRGRAIGVTAASALLLALLPVGAVQAATHTPTAPSPIGIVHVVHGNSPAVTKVSGTAAADESTGCGIKSVNPTGVVLGGSEVVQNYSVTTTGTGCTGNVTWVLRWDNGNVFVDSYMNQAYWWPDEYRNGSAKSYGMSVELTNGDGTSVSKSFNYSFRRRATFGSTFNASPEPLKLGAKLTLKATLKRISWDGNKMPYIAYTKQPVKVQFKPTGNTGYTTIKTVKSGTGGKISTTVTAVQTGTWRLSFAGTSTTGASNSGTDAVTVK